MSTLDRLRATAKVEIPMDTIIKFYDSVWANVTDANEKPRELMQATWHKDLEPMGLDRDIYVTAIAFYDRSPVEDYDEEVIQSVKEKGGHVQMVVDNELCLLTVALRFTTTSAMNEEYDYTQIYDRSNTREPLCFNHTVYCIGREAFNACVDEVIRDWKRLRYYTRDDLVMDKWCR